MKKEKYYYIKVKEYINDGIHNGFYDVGYFDQLEIWLGVEGFKVKQYVVSTVSEKSVALRYKYKGLIEKKIKETIDTTKDLEYFYPYEDNIYRYKFEIVEE